MTREYIADKKTLDEVNQKVGDAGGSNIFAKLNSLVSAIADHAAAWTAAKAGNLDTKVSSRAPASTALSTAQWTNTRAGYLDKLNSGVPVANLSNKIIKSVQRGTVNAGNSNVTISSVNMSKTFVTLSFGGITDVGTAVASLVNSNTLNIKNPHGSPTVVCSWEVIEFY